MEPLHGPLQNDRYFVGQGEHKARPDALRDKSPEIRKTRLFGTKDFHFDERDNARAGSFCIRTAAT